jgi:hypothetical protein
VLVKPFVHLHDVEYLIVEVVKGADLHCMEEVGLKEVTHHIANMSKHVESSVNMVRREFGIPCLGDCITERTMSVVIPPRVLLHQQEP